MNRPYTLQSARIVKSGDGFQRPYMTDMAREKATAPLQPVRGVHFVSDGVMTLIGMVVFVAGLAVIWGAFG